MKKPTSAPPSTESGLLRPSLDRWESDCCPGPTQPLARFSEFSHLRGLWPSGDVDMRRVLRSLIPRRFFLALALLLGAASNVPVRAQEAAVPYDRDLLRLAEILGSLQHLRTLCGANEGQLWRDQMQALLDAEIPAGERRNRIAASFNRGYRGFAQTHRTCTPAANAAIQLYLEEGARIARDITARYAD